MNQYMRKPEDRQNVVRMVRSKKRRRRRFSLAAKWLTTLLLAAVLVAVGIYYTGQYLKDQEYIRYPLRYEELIVRNADEFSLEPWHVAAVVRCESSFREAVTSEAGARGLMQIMPETFTWLQNYRTDFMPEVILESDELYDPQTNIDYGVYLLSYLLDLYNGNTSLAICAYNAGYGNVDEWLANGTISEWNVTAEDIPFPETSNYLTKVTSATEMYRELYFSNTDTDTDTDTEVEIYSDIDDTSSEYTESTSAFYTESTYYNNDYYDNTYDDSYTYEGYDDTYYDDSYYDDYYYGDYVY